MASLAEAVIGAIGGYGQAAQQTGLEKARAAREKAFREEGWARDDAKTASDRAYQEGVRAEERKYQQEQKQEERDYQSKVRAEDRQFRADEAEKARLASAAEKEAQRQFKRDTKKEEPKSSAEIKADLAREKKEDERIKAYDSTVTTLEEVDALLSHPGLKSAVGASSLLPTIPGGDAADFEVALDAFVGNLTLENMSKMSGVLSDSDIKLLKNASSGLDIKMSEDKFIERLNTIREKLQTKLSDYEQSAPSTTTTQTEMPQFSQIGRFNVRMK